MQESTGEPMVYHFVSGRFILGKGEKTEQLNLHKCNRLSAAWFQPDDNRGNMCDFRAGGLDDVWAHRPLPLTTTETVGAIFLLLL